MLSKDLCTQILTSHYVSVCVSELVDRIVFVRMFLQWFFHQQKSKYHIHNLEIWKWCLEYDDFSHLIDLKSWDDNASKMHLTPQDWQQNLSYAWYVTSSTQNHLPLCSTHIYWLKGKKGLTSYCFSIQVEHFSPCDRSSDISIPGTLSSAHSLTVKCHCTGVVRL